MTHTWQYEVLIPTVLGLRIYNTMNTNSPNQKQPIQWSQYTIVPSALLHYNQYTSLEMKLKGMEQLILIHLLSHAFGSTVVFPSQERLATYMGTTRKSVGNHINTLVEKGWLIKRNNGHKLNNSYDLFPALNRLSGTDRMYNSSKPSEATQPAPEQDCEDF